MARLGRAQHFKPQTIPQWSAEHTAVPTTAPSDVIVTQGDTQLLISWNDITNSYAQTYTVQRSLSAGGTYATVGTPTGTEYLDTGLTNGTTYFYKVFATSPAGSSAASSIVSATATARPATPADKWYKYGAAPTGVTQTNARAYMRTHYDNWVAYTFTKRNTMQAGRGAWRLQVLDQTDPAAGTAGGTFSEGIGYGMFVAAYMANWANPQYDINAQKYFNGLWLYYKKYRNANGLMNWRVDSHGIVTGTGGATDGDIDVAVALYLMHRIYGSAGAVNYLADAITLINAIRDFEFLPANDPTYPNVMMNGDQWGSGTNQITPDYFAPAWYRLFKLATGDTRWDAIITANYSRFLTYWTSLYSFGLVPDNATRTGGVVSGQSYDYGYNAVRMPWRISAEYLWYGIAAAKTQLTNMASDQKTRSGNVAGSAFAQPKIDQSSRAAYINQTFLSGYGLAGTADSTTADWAGNVLTWLNTNASNQLSYFGSSLGMVALLAMSGEMVTFDTTSTQTQTGISRITKVVPVTQTATARITAKGTQTQTGTARIAATTLKTETGIARIQKIVPQTQTATARISAITPKTQTATARITATTVKTATGTARITATTLKTETAVARIQKTVPQTETATARIQKVVPQTETATARISATTKKTQTGVARIQKTVSTDAMAKYAVVFNNTGAGGTTDFVKVVNATVLNFGNNDSYSVVSRWKTTLTADQSLSEKWADGTINKYAWAIRTSSPTNVSFNIYDGTANPGVGATVPNDGAMHRMVGVRDFANLQLRIYLDGAFQSSTGDNTTGDVSSDHNIYIGARSSGYAGMKGNVQEFLLYHRVLTAAEIANIENGVYPGDYVLWLPFWEGQGTLVKDQSANGNNGTITNATWVQEGIRPVISGKSRIQKSVPVTQTATARITATATQTQTGTARIQKTVTQTQTAVSRITRVVPVTETAIARITATTQKTQSATARITATTLKTETATARITATTTKTQSAVSRITAVSGVRTNFVTNPSFEVDLTSWSAYGGSPTCILTRDTSQSVAGTASMKIAASTTGDGQGFVGGAPIVVNNLVIGATYVFSLSIFAPSTMTGQTNTYVGSGASNTNKEHDLVAGWNRIEMSFVPASTNAGCYIRLRGGWANLVAYIDAVQVELGATATAYFDGNASPGIWTGTANASTSIAPLHYLLGTARITAKATKTQTGVARITAITQKTQSGTARITATTARTETATARITVTTQKTETGIARITATATKTVTALTRITATSTKTETGIARITNIVPKSQSGIARITAKGTQTETATARITATATRTETATARITAKSIKTETGISRITVVTPKTQTGTAKIVVTGTTQQTQTATARITAKATKTQTATARITNTTQKTASATARITAAATKTETAVARITATTKKTQTATARITNTGTTSGNLVQNGDFSNVPAGTIPTTTSGTWVDGTAAGSATDAGFHWYQGSTNGQSVSFSTTVKRGAFNSLKLSITAPGNFIEARSAATGYFSNDGFSVKPGALYRISFWLAAQNVSGSAATGGTLQFLTNDGAGGSTGETGVGGIVANQPFTYYSFTFQTTTTAKKAHVEPRVYGHNGLGTLVGDFYFADIQVVELGQSETAVSRITATATKTQTGTARIQRTVPQTQTGTARIAATTLKTATGTARIAKTSQTTQSGTARIQRAAQQTQTAISRIQKVVAATETGTARIAATTTKTETGIASINKRTTQTQTGTARIQIVTVQTMTGRARIGLPAHHGKEKYILLTSSGLHILQTPKPQSSVIETKTRGSTTAQTSTTPLSTLTTAAPSVTVL